MYEKLEDLRCDSGYRPKIVKANCALVTWKIYKNFGFKEEGHPVQCEPGSKAAIWWGNPTEDKEVPIILQLTPERFNTKNRDVQYFVGIAELDDQVVLDSNVDTEQIADAAKHATESLDDAIHLLNKLLPISRLASDGSNMLVTQRVRQRNLTERN